MLSIRFLTVLLLSLPAPAFDACDRVEAEAPWSDLAAELDALLDAHAPAAGVGVAAAVAVGDDFFWMRGHGRIAPGGPPVSPETVFLVASIKKQFTAAAILRLAENGLLELEDRVTDHLPDAPVQGRPVRIRHLLQHTSGLPDYMRFVDLRGSYTRETVLDLIAAHPFDFEPGTSWRYNNSGYFILGVLIEELTGEDYAGFVRRDLLEPLGLHATSVCGTPPNETFPPGNRVQNQHASPAPPPNLLLGLGAGNLCSMPGDLVRWARALARGEVVSSASYARMTRPAVLDDGSAIQYPPGAPADMTGYGLGIMVGANDGRPVHFHGGGIPGFSSYLTYFPDQDVAVAVVINQTPANPAALLQRLADLPLAARGSAVPRPGKAEAGP
jgi:D-alanyl-D-alanine carboxypeptidase